MVTEKSDDTIVAVPVTFFHLFGSSYEAAFYGVWYSVVFSELLATLMSFLFFRGYKKRYKYA